MQQTVLIVEDSEGAAAPLEVALQAIIGIRVQLFSSARDALKALGSTPNHVAALVTDLHLPSMDGFELIKLIRGDQRYTTLPIIVISGDTQPGTLERLIRLGANAYFPKPYSPTEIRQKLESLLNEH
jgi:two-component system, chemotaxis family, chemotaxis protein CheY